MVQCGKGSLCGPYDPPASGPFSVLSEAPITVSRLSSNILSVIIETLKRLTAIEHCEITKKPAKTYAGIKGSQSKRAKF